MAGERAALAFLKEKGYRILQTNFSCKQGEIDIVAEDEETLVFVEVKTREVFGDELPEAALTRSKKRKVARAAREFMKKYHAHDRIFRFDLIGIDYHLNGQCKIHHWQNTIDYRRALVRWR